MTKNIWLGQKLTNTLFYEMLDYRQGEYWNMIGY